MKTHLILTTVAVASMAVNAWFIQSSLNTAAALDRCAERENVYKCKLVTQPAEAARVVYKQAMLLPPPQ